ncbi:MAG: hypothetical protein GY768_22975 [Planctomycetaceae bacterium]|nr:hypothetical protein [Planctomycetaceae bacterium]
MNSPRRFPLSVLFFLVTVAGVAVSLIAPAFAAVPSFASLLSGDAASLPALLAWPAGFGLLGALLGCVIGLYHYRRRRGVGWGGLSGLLTGGCLGSVATIDDYDQLAATCIIGSLLLVGYGAFARIGTRRFRIRHKA